jgi:hypothetical protein
MNDRYTNQFSMNMSRQERQLLIQWVLELQYLWHIFLLSPTELSSSQVFK